MKNLSLVLNIVLLVAVIVLYVLYFSGRSSGSPGSIADTSRVNLKVAYINSDTVVKYYDYSKVNKQQLESKSKQMDQDYRNRAIGFQSEVNAYKRSVNSMTLGQAQATEEDLAKKQQNLQMYQQSLTQQLMDEEAKLSKELYERVTTYLKDYAQPRGIQVVLKYDPSSDLLYGGQAIDITQEVIKGLNEQYQSQKGDGPKAPADTTAKK